MFGRRRRRGAADQEAEIYQVRERLVDLGDDYWIETNEGRRVFKRDTYGMRIDRSADAALILAATVVIDHMAHD